MLKSFLKTTVPAAAIGPGVLSSEARLLRPGLWVLVYGLGLWAWFMGASAGAPGQGAHQGCTSVVYIMGTCTGYGPRVTASGMEIGPVSPAVFEHSGR